MHRLFLLTVMMMILSGPVLAQTPDGLTPAEETVCDPLKADEVTKGLYGLCVAFCEAHDTTNVTTPIAPEELVGLTMNAPSGRILDNYNRKKQDGDPDMPCLLVQEPCPCFSQEELSSLDGYDSEGLYMDYFYYQELNWGQYNIAILQEKNSSAPNHMQEIFMFSTNHSDDYCYYTNDQTTPAVSRVLRTGDDGTLTYEEYDKCYQMVIDHISAQ